ncbi:oligosaccharide flippase family protein [Pedobacter sp. BS3]|uniref:lipopolysaccharide biosynthesis protein n=1 Tax=Pedobacter sp. BS3 TaxID=2567937 RepID=UPI0011EEE47B|nr:MATE family efflux transporter [Pedobacter sp. BS3]TZF84454.1 oligosaccharide flippase family protein [Pedobacter sp. BS3]
MISKAVTIINAFFTKGDTRSINAKKNIVSSFITKVASIGVSLLVVPLTIHYVNVVQYGIWLTLSSIIAWFNFFDIGFGHGLRNKFAESVAKGKYKLARIYVSTTYAILALISTGAIAIFFVLNHYLNWSRILNTPGNLNADLQLLALVVFVCFCIQFVLQLITIILTADQQPAKAAFFKLLGNVLSLLVIFILTKTTRGNLIALGLSLGAMPIMVLLASSSWFYSHEYKRYAPSFSYVRFKFSKDLLNLGGKFFIIQIGALVLFQTDNIIVTQVFGAKEVTTFNVAYKLFSVILMIFTIVSTPLWSAYTDAYARNDIVWIQRSLQKLQLFWIGIIFSSVLLLVVSPFVFHLWIGDSVSIPFSLSLAMVLYVITYTWQTIHVSLLNGIGKIKLQLYLVVASALVNIPLAFLLGKTIGLAGISLANSITFIGIGIVFFIQTRKIINNNAKGIWNA